VLVPAPSLVVCEPTAPAPESVVVTAAGGWVTVVGGAAAAVVSGTVAFVVTAGVGAVSGVGFVAPVVVLDDEPLEDDPLVVAPLPACVIEPAGTVNGGVPFVSAVEPPPPPQEATPNAIVTPISTATP
jgi:hypothetical protein